MSSTKQGNRRRTMFLSRRWLFLPPIILGLVVVISLARSQKDLPRVEPTEEASPLRVVQAKHQPLSASSVGYGTVKAKRVWSAVAEVGGRVMKTFQPLRSGVSVTKDQLLVKIDAADYELQRSQRQSELDQAMADRTQLQLSEQSDVESLLIQQDLLAVRKAEVDRLETLRGSDATSRSESDLAQAAYLTQAQAVQNLKSSLQIYPSRQQSAMAKIEFANSRLAESVRDLDRTEIRAPMAGLLSNVSLEIGQFVGPTQQLFKLLDISAVEIEAQFSLSQLMSLLPPPSVQQSTEIPTDSELTQILLANLSATVVSRSGEVELRYPATPIRLAELINEQTRTLGVVVEVAGEPLRATVSPPGSTLVPLRPGMFCEVVLKSRHHHEGVLLDRTSFDRDSVYIVDDESRLRRRRVQVQQLSGEKFAVTHGLQDGDWVVLNPPTTPKEGMLVMPQVESDPEIAMLPKGSAEN